MTKEQLAKLGIVVDKDLTDDELHAELLKVLNGKDKEIADGKNLLSKRNSEIAELKRKDQEKLTEEEKTLLRITELEKANNDLTRKLSLNEKVSALVELGYDKETAVKYATAELDGKSTIEFQKAFLDKQREAIKAELLKGGKIPNTENQPSTIKTKEDLAKASYEEVLKFQQENPQLFAELTKN